MTPRRELLAFAATLAMLVGGFFAESLVGGKVLSPADVVFAQASFAEFRGGSYEPANRLLMDPVLQFQPWLEFNRAMLRQGRLPLWNSRVGCGAPHLASGQSAVFDPFHAIAYLGRLPEAYAWMAAARLWVAGMGMFLLARSWRLGPWGRWFAGLTFPFCGFLVVWLQYPVTSVAVWMPWLFLATDRALGRPSAGSAARLALVVGLVLVAGHVQTSAHVLMAAGVYAAWRSWASRRNDGAETIDHRSTLARTPIRKTSGGTVPLPPSPLVGEGCGGGSMSERAPHPPPCPPPQGGRERNPDPRTQSVSLATWAVGVILGIALAAIEVVPLGFYLSRSPVWADREKERPAVGTLAKPRLLDFVCTALPYAYGSQRRGHPNLARALGVHNLNESAGGFAGLATLIWLAPLALSARGRDPRVRFLAGLVAVGTMAAFDVFPVANALRAIPVLNVTDNRRLTLWVAFGLVLLGGIGLDHLGAMIESKRWKAWTLAWVFGATILALAASAFPRLGPQLRERALRHYASAASETPGADAAAYRERAERQVSQALRFLPRYWLLASGHVLALVALATGLRMRKLGITPVRCGLLGITLADLFAFGFGLNPAIPREDDRPESAVIAYLKRIAPPPARCLAIGAELPPNLLMRYGLADIRNYDSVELSRNLNWFEPLYEPEKGRSSRTSRRTITWAGVLRARERLRAARVAALVGATTPPDGAFENVERVGRVWVARLEPGAPKFGPGDGLFRVDAASDSEDRRVIPETYDPGWKAEADGKAIPIEPYQGVFLSVHVPRGAREIVLRYEPPEVRIAAVISVLASVTTAMLWMRVGSKGLGRFLAPEAWKPSRRRVRIERSISISSRPVPASPEG